jgi:hypothetical protein
MHLVLLTLLRGRNRQRIMARRIGVGGDVLPFSPIAIFVFKLVES